MITHAKAIDESLPNFTHRRPDALRAADTRGHRSLKEESVLREYNYFFKLDDEEDDYITTRNPNMKKEVEKGSSVWDRGHVLLPQLPMTYASDETLVKMTEEHANLASGKRHMELGDGAPIMALWKLQRLALRWIRKRRAGDQAARPLDELKAYVSSSESEDGGALGDEASSKASGESDDESLLSDQSDVAGNIPARDTEKTKKRTPPKELNDKQSRILVLCRLLPGLWHAMQESIIVNLDGNKDEWAHLGVLWKSTPGRLKFMLGGGNVNEHLHETFSAICGLVKSLLRRYRDTNPDDPSYVGFDEWFDNEAKKSPVMARWRNLIEHTLLTKGLHDSMRQGMLSNLRLLLEQLAELCAATGKWKYMR